MAVFAPHNRLSGNMYDSNSSKESTTFFLVKTSDRILVKVECPAVTPEVVLKASGHVDRFTDLMVTDKITGDCHRADHLLKNALEAKLEDRKLNLTAQAKAVSLCWHSSFCIQDCNNCQHRRAFI